MSVHSILSPPPEGVYQNPLAYTWKQVWGTEAMRQHAASRTVVRDVSFPPNWFQGRYSRNWPEDNPNGGLAGPYYFGYAGGFDHLVDGVEFDDGTMLICAGIDTFGGTDADNYVSNDFFILTPITQTNENAAS